MGGADVLQRVPAELLQRRPRELERHDRLGDHRERLDRLHVRALDERLRRLAAREIDRVQGAHERRQRLHRGASDDRLAVRDARLETAGAVRPAVEPGVDLVVRLGAAPPREREAVAHLDALDGLDPHQREGESRIEAIALLRVRPEARRDARRDHLDDPAQRVAILAGRIGRLAHALVGRLAADLDRSPRDVDSELAQERLRDRPRGHVHRGVPRARPLERVTNVVVPVLQHPGEVGVPRARQADRLRPLARRLALGRPGAHPPRPVRVVAVPHDERQGSPERASPTEAGEHLDLVALELLARAPAVALLPSPKIRVDRVLLEPEPRRQPGHDRDEGRPVRLSRGHEPERHPSILRVRSGAVLRRPGGGELRDERPKTAPQRLAGRERG